MFTIMNIPFRHYQIPIKNKDSGLFGVKNSRIRRALYMSYLKSFALGVANHYACEYSVVSSYRLFSHTVCPSKT